MSNILVSSSLEKGNISRFVSKQQGGPNMTVSRSLISLFYFQLSAAVKLLIPKTE